MKPIAVRRTSSAKALRLPGENDPRLVAAYAAAQHLLRRKYVTGIGVGYERRGGAKTGRVSITVLVARKRPDADLRAAQRFPDNLGGVPVDVVESVLELQMSDAEMRARRKIPSDPLRPGVQIKTADGDLGTLGLVVRGQAGGKFLLGSGHVMWRTGVDVYQPHTSAAGHLTARVVQTERSRVDAAIASFTGRAVDDRPIGVSTRITSWRDVRRRDVLYMSGALSGQTNGVVELVGQRSITYADGTTRIVPGFEIRNRPGVDQPLSASGDSGSLWFDANGNAVGLHVGGGKDAIGYWAFACHIDDVFEVFRVSI